MEQPHGPPEQPDPTPARPEGSWERTDPRIPPDSGLYKGQPFGQKNSVEPILKSFPIGILLRSLFAGAFFVISYYVASHNPLEPVKIDGPTMLSVVLPVSLFAGVTAYGVHRSVVFPFFEYCFDTDRARAFRQCAPLISDSTIEKLFRRWDRAAEDKGKLDCERARRLTTWADYTQLQYSSAVCIALGALAGFAIDPGKHVPDLRLIFLGIGFFLAAVVSDWRLRSVEEQSYELPRSPDVAQRADAPTSPL